MYYRRGENLNLLRENLTEKQMDLVWKELKWWQKESIVVKKVVGREELDKDER